MLGARGESALKAPTAFVVRPSAPPRAFAARTENFHTVPN
jgi:hypothetical protein